MSISVITDEKEASLVYSNLSITTFAESAKVFPIYLDLSNFSPSPLFV